MSKKSEYAKEFSAIQKAKGLCIRCANKAREGYAECDDCRKKGREGRERRRAYRRANGLCVHCGQPSENADCDNCLAKTRARRARLHTYRKVTNLCSDCDQPALEGRRHCEKHKEENKMYRRAARKSRPGFYLIVAAKRRAKDRGIEFDLALEDIEPLPEYCPIFGIKLVYAGTEGHTGRMSANSPSLDRINPNLGYIKGNVAVISQRANHIKLNATVFELEAIAKWIARNNY